MIVEIIERKLRGNEPVSIPFVVNLVQWKLSRTKSTNKSALKRRQCNDPTNRPTKRGKTRNYRMGERGESPEVQVYTQSPERNTIDSDQI